MFIPTDLKNLILAFGRTRTNEELTDQIQLNIAGLDPQGYVNARSLKLIIYRVWKSNTNAEAKELLRDLWKRDEFDDREWEVLGDVMIEIASSFQLTSPWD